MKKLIISLGVIVLFLIGGVYLGTAVHPPSTKTLPTSIQEGKQIQKSPQTSVTSPGKPDRLIIPKISVDAAVESVGLDAEKRMDVPKHNEDVGWYNLGFKPGEKGSAVIDGHLDTVTGAPAVFWNLKKLSVGDKIQVKDVNNKTYTYQVSDVQIFPFDKVPLQQVFASTDKARLNLITCGGTWDAVKKNYADRTVVYSELVQ